MYTQNVIKTDLDVPGSAQQNETAFIQGACLKEHDIRVPTCIHILQLLHVPVNRSDSSALMNISTVIPTLRLTLIAMAMATVTVTRAILEVPKPRSVESIMNNRQ